MLDRVPITVTTPGFFCGEEEPRSRYSTKAVIPAIKTTEAETVPTILINLVPRMGAGLAEPINAILVCEKVAQLNQSLLYFFPLFGVAFRYGHPTTVFRRSPANLTSGGLPQRRVW